jgi:hypothetical protein
MQQITNPHQLQTARRITYWFAVPQEVQDFVKAVGKPVVTELGFVECTNSDENLAMESCGGNQIKFVREMVLRCLWGFNQLDKDGKPSGRKLFDRSASNIDLDPAACYESWNSQVQSLCHTAYSKIHGVSPGAGKDFLSKMTIETT